MRPPRRLSSLWRPCRTFKLQQLITIPSRALPVWRRLYQRFKLEPFPATVGPDVGKTIIPITDADTLLRENRAVQETNTAPAGDDTEFTILTVPGGKRWTVYDIDVSFTSGDNTIKQFLVGDTSRNLNVILVAFTPAAGKQEFLPVPIKLEEGDTIKARTTGTGGAATVMESTAWIDEEDAF